MDPLSRPILLATSDEALLLHLLQVVFFVKDTVFEKKETKEPKVKNNKCWSYNVTRLVPKGVTRSINSRFKKAAAAGLSTFWKARQKKRKENTRRSWPPPLLNVVRISRTRFSIAIHKSYPEFVKKKKKNIETISTILWNFQSVYCCFFFFCEISFGSFYW